MAFGLFQPMFTMNFMEVGGCGKEFVAAGQKCQKAADGGDDRDDVEACIKATAALRRCMAVNETFFKPYYIGALDAGIKDNEKRGYGGAEFELDEKNQMMRWRWWYNMRRR